MRQSSGFSLVELSIVLVILGLLVGGILAGQALIHAAELRSVSRDLASYQTAINAFRDKYFALPGDMRNATDFWGVAGGTGSNSVCYNLQTSNPATCNGNGDGEIQYTYESMQSWEHLARAGLVAGNYLGETPTARTWVAGQNLPATRFAGVAVQLAHRTAYERATNYLIVAGELPASNTLTGPAFTAADAWNLDTKMDDGHASRGQLLAGNALNVATYSSWCTTGWRIDADPPGDDYTNLEGTTAGKGCHFYFRF